jgi:hypothetical protein
MRSFLQKKSLDNIRAVSLKKNLKKRKKKKEKRKKKK